MRHKKSKSEKEKEKVKEANKKSEKELNFEKLSSFFDKYISKGFLTIKSATLFDLKRIEYIKGKDLKIFFTENFDLINKDIISIMNINLGTKADEESLQKFYELNQQNNILHYLKKLPGDKAKYPKRLLPLQKDDDPKLETHFTDGGFYLLNRKVEKTNKPLIYLVLLIALILFIVLFPVWPLKMKLGVLNFLIACCIFIIVFLLSTIVISFIGLLFGYDIDIFPMIDEHRLSWKDRLFNPFITIQKRTDDPCWFVIVRTFILIIILCLIVIACFFPRVPVACYTACKKFLVMIFSYSKKKIEDFHYHRSAVVEQGQSFLDDIGNL